MSFIHIVPTILGEVLRGRTSGQSKQERTEALAREIDDWLFSDPYPIDWSIGANEGRSRDVITSNQVERPRLARPRGGVITYDDGEMSIYARRSRS